jgi:hypothetical protein
MVIASDPEPADILYSTQLYPTPPKSDAPLTDPPGADVVTADPLAGVVPVAGVVGLVLEHPAIATAITTMMIAKILIREIFILISSVYPKLPDNVPL